MNDYISAFSGATIDQAVAKARRIHFGTKEINIPNLTSGYKIRLSEAERYLPDQIFLTIKTGGNAGDPANYVSATAAYEHLVGDQYGWFVYLRSTLSNGGSNANLSGTYYVNWLAVESNEMGSDDNTEVNNIRQEFAELLNTKVDKEDDKGLSTNDFTNEDKANIAQNTADITDLKQAVNILSNVDFANRYYAGDAQANTPFVTENYEYIAPVEASTGVFSKEFLLPNGKYRIIVTSSSRPSNMEMVIYNPYYGCYYYDPDNDYVDFDWTKQDDKYICDFEIKTDYEQNYVMLGDVSKNMDRWNNLNVKLYRYNQSENMVTKAEFNKQSDDIANLTANQLYVSNAGYLYTKNAIVLNGATAIGNKGYYNCQNLLNVTIQESVSSIGSEAFAHSYNLKSVVISNGVTSIGVWAFVNCTGLENLVLPASLTSIGSSPFSGCTALNTVTLGNGFNCNGLNLTGCPLTVDSIIAMFESLADLTGEAVKTLTLGADNLAKLTDEQKQIATNKNWNLA